MARTDVRFDTGLATLKPGGRRAVDQLAALMRQREDREIVVEGFTDSSGSSEMNQALSERRAQAARRPGGRSLQAGSRRSGSRRAVSVKSIRWPPTTRKRALTWGGLKGGISIALALSLPAFEHRDLFLAATYAVVVFSVLVQGLTLGPLATRIGRGAHPGASSRA